MDMRDLLGLKSILNHIRKEGPIKVNMRIT